MCRKNIFSWRFFFVLFQAWCSTLVAIAHKRKLFHYYYCCCFLNAVCVYFYCFVPGYKSTGFTCTHIKIYRNKYFNGNDFLSFALIFHVCFFFAFLRTLLFFILALLAVFRFSFFYIFVFSDKLYVSHLTISLCVVSVLSHTTCAHLYILYIPKIIKYYFAFAERIKCMTLQARGRDRRSTSETSACHGSSHSMKN